MEDGLKRPTSHWLNTTRAQANTTDEILVSEHPHGCAEKRTFGTGVSDVNAEERLKRMHSCPPPLARQPVSLRASSQFAPVLQRLNNSKITCATAKTCATARTIALLAVVLQCTCHRSEQILVHQLSGAAMEKTMENDF